MDLKNLNALAPWDWPGDAGEMLLKILGDRTADESERLLAADLAGNLTVVDDELATALLSVLRNDRETDDLRAMAAGSLGPALEHVEIFGYEDPDDILLSETVFHELQRSLRELYGKADVSKEVKRRILEAAVHACQEWHGDAVRTAYASDDQDWRLTAVFGMRFVRGFDRQILEALDSANPHICYEAVCAAGNWGVEAAWPKVAEILTAAQTDKPLLLAAIESAVAIRPQEAAEILSELAYSEDEDIAAAVCEALAIAAEPWVNDEDEEASYR